MKRFLILLCLAVALSVISCATTQTPGVDKMKCRDTKLTGSSIPQRLCMTEREKQNREMDDKLEMERMLRNQPQQQ